MTKQSEEWRIISSTSRFFPVHSKVKLISRAQDAARIDLAVEWEKSLSLLLLEDKAFPDTVPGTFRGDFGHPKGEADEELFQIVVTVCPAQGIGAPQYLCGQLYELNAGIESGATGVWVAEEERPTPQGECT